MREESQRRWRLSYVFQDDHRILALVELTKNVRLTVQKVPYASENADKMLYITDADKILSFAGTIKSSRFTNRVYYIYPGMIPGKVDVGDTSKL